MFNVAENSGWTDTVPVQKYKFVCLTWGDLVIRFVSGYVQCTIAVLCSFCI